MENALIPPDIKDDRVPFLRRAKSSSRYTRARGRACQRASRVSLEALWHGRARAIICRPLGERIVNSPVNGNRVPPYRGIPNNYQLLIQPTIYQLKSDAWITKNVGNLISTPIGCDTEASRSAH